MITKEWLEEHYIDKNMTIEECAKLLHVKSGAIVYLIGKFNLSKMENGHYKDPRFNKRIGLKYNDEWKQNIKLGQPQAKKVVRISKKCGRKVYNTVTEAAKENGLFRENVKKACQGKNKTSGWYRWEYCRTYGEEIVHRLHTLDFTLPLDDMMRGMYAGLPDRMNKNETLKYYTRKIQRIFKDGSYAENLQRTA